MVADYTKTPMDSLVALIRKACDGIAHHAKDRPVVVLGRDAWPLVPVLHHRGHDVQYFVFSRLQIGDPHTEQQWLLETKPGALVVDTGYAGSIIDRIRDLDPTVGGALMSSSVPDKYPSICEAQDRGAIVADLEYSPKLIKRAKGMSRGRLVYSEGYDGTALSAKDTLKWNEYLCTSLGVPKVWAGFTGMTPWQRIGCRPEEVTRRYILNMEARAERGLPTKPPKFEKPRRGGEYGWKKKSKAFAQLQHIEELGEVEKKDYGAFAPYTGAKNPVPPGVAIHTKNGVEFAVFDHMLMIDWDIDDGSHADPENQCKVKSVEEARERLIAWCKENPGHSFAFYRTPGGARALCVSHFFHPADEKAQALLEAVGCDEHYRTMSKANGVWGCRISPKPGRKDDYVAKWTGSIGSHYKYEKSLYDLMCWHDAQCAKFGGGFAF